MTTHILNDRYKIDILSIEPTKDNYTKKMVVTDTQTEKTYERALYEYETTNPVYIYILTVLSRHIKEVGEVDLIFCIDVFRQNRIATQLHEKLKQPIGHIIPSIQQGDIRAFTNKNACVRHYYNEFDASGLKQFKDDIINASTHSISAFDSITDYLIASLSRCHIIYDYGNPLYVVVPNENEEPLI